jgi:hypothetical protein
VGQIGMLCVEFVQEGQTVRKRSAVGIHESDLEKQVSLE